MGGRTLGLLVWLALAGLIASTVAGGVGLLLLRSQRIEEGRPSVPGRVLSAEIVRKPARSFDMSGSGPLFLKWMLEVRYGYRVGDRDYEGLSHGRQTSLPSAEGADAAAPPEWLREMQALYPVGGTVQVRYRPADPSESVIEIRGGAGRILIGAAIGFMLSLALFFVVRR